MKPVFICMSPAATVCLVLAASSQSRPFDSLSNILFSAQSRLGHPHHNPSSQTMPPSEEVSTGIIISDVIGKTQTIGIFSGLTRDIDAISGRLEDAAQNATVLAPDNNAMKNLARKPWEDPKDYETLGTNAYQGEDGQERAQKNLRTFVETHIVPQSPWKEREKVKTLAGKEIWYETEDGKTKIQPAGVEVVSIADKVSNGEVWVLDGSLDPRQYVPASGQAWTSLSLEASKQENHFEQDATDPRIWFITTSPKARERCILIQTPAGNILWDLISFIDQGTIDFVKSKGGLKAIVISHPHFYTTHLEWAHTFGCPVYTSKADEEWLNRKDAYGLRELIDGTTEIVDGVTAIQAGGHFDGSLILHWDKNIFIADTMMSVPSGFYHKDRLPGTTSYSFMWSYPNMIPLPPPKIHGIWKALKPFDFEASFGGFPGQNVRREDLKQQVLESMKIFVKTAGHANADILLESL
ncbi:hypothetical protein K504DRAFT_483099 [Pleomassaria siparia CBS 279.74]|uniref:FAS1 domain-containing protein n=1 Tax=Pleomassaria siparia CBS 279.74 TaxID=1314801 RepID=A0A6G1K4U8_9PLEO|nr:hypothetical protein K504DRAFT_483099 [Pleomassaria siparia CBS 279.74]